MESATQHRAPPLDPALLARIGGLELRARRLVEGLISGMHRSPYRGFSVEFVEHRKYSQGDDLRHLDWKVFGRSDKFYVKQYEQESNLQLMLVVDASESMSYGSLPEGLTKHAYASVIAAALAYLVLQQADAVGLTTFDRQIGRIVRASNKRGQFNLLLHELEAPPAGPKTHLGAVLEQLAEKLSHRHLVILLSDLFDDVDAVLRGLRHLVHRRHEPVVLHVLDHQEIEFDFHQRTRFRGLEGFDPLITEPRLVREAYRGEIQSFINRLRRGCHELAVDYELMDTRRPLDVALSAYLATRERRS